MFESLNGYLSYPEVCRFFFQWFFPEKNGAGNLGWNGYRVGTPSYKLVRKNTMDPEKIQGNMIPWRY
jgi:hypothetical protein